jgi:hypothetical protein
MRITLATCLGAAATLLFAASASAAVRYAEPGGDGPAGSCPKSNPCDIQDAVEDPTVADGDEVVLLGGTYALPLTDDVEVDEAIDLHGVAGETRPLISAVDGPALDVVAPARIHDLRAHSVNERGLDSFGGAPIVERVVVTSENARACYPPEAPGVLRDSVCYSEGTGVEAVGALVSTNGSINYQLRNVTAIATGAGSHGINFQTDNGIFLVNVRNLIADGPAIDVRAAETGTGGVAIALQHSNYAVASPNGGGVAVTQPGTVNNQTAPAELVDPTASNFRQLPGSPTIDAGGGPPDVDLLGSLDFDRQPRIQASAPDIGADEFDDRLKLKAKAKKKQKTKKLKVKVSCPEEECYVLAKGRAKAGGERFRLKRTKERFLEPGEKAKLRLKAKNAGELKDLLANSEGEAKITVRGTDAGGVKAKKKLKVKLTG